ncbi:hypothetical protein ACFL6S_30240, partial [Candidatus Poribacteria bacterium]
PEISQDHYAMNQKPPRRVLHNTFLISPQVAIRIFSSISFGRPRVFQKVDQPIPTILHPDDARIG